MYYRLLFFFKKRNTTWQGKKNRADLCVLIWNSVYDKLSNKTKIK